LRASRAEQGQAVVAAEPYLLAASKAAVAVMDNMDATRYIQTAIDKAEKS